ncbi:serine/threonine-protein kinase LATS2-like isoform X3 [Paramacrobiotus metropolitanus]|uniref:serine/threonine-protein kinase LATS2-like isoform X3 n=1 Tax=Paramacrobiotus metropolitanus TaxID=2943436 RepID=UPI002445770E|nr:serine/threonine-protein kinase LATS2-like isoform X3 [Paramacrobiotus metropolitanus]XP_055351052.1 serine/threonine-protein kinase LATS2-like isoform X3 [Paramacrobiotus metropolitanus]
MGEMLKRLCALSQVIYWQHYLDVDSYSLSAEARDLILCLCSDAEDRLGNGFSPYAPSPDPLVPSTVRGCEEIKNHPFFHGLDLRSIRKQLSPHRPQLQHDLDTSNFEDFTDTPSPVEGWGGHSGEEENWAGIQPFLHFTFRRFFDNGGEEERTPRLMLKEPPSYEKAVSPAEGSETGKKKAKEAVYV